MRARIITALSAGVLAVLLLCGAASCGNAGGDDDFTRKCNAKGGIVHTHKRGGSTSRTCDPAPAPRPGPGWQ